MYARAEVLKKVLMHKDYKIAVLVCCFSPLQILHWMVLNATNESKLNVINYDCFGTDTGQTNSPSIKSY